MNVWKTYKNVMTVKDGWGEVSLATKEVEPKVDRTLPVAYFCDCPDAFEHFYNKKPIRWAETLPMVPTSSAKGVCKFCGYAVLAKRVNISELSRENRQVGGKRRK